MRCGRRRALDSRSSPRVGPPDGGRPLKRPLVVLRRPLAMPLRAWTRNLGLGYRDWRPLGPTQTRLAQERDRKDDGADDLFGKYMRSTMFRAHLFNSEHIVAQDLHAEGALRHGDVVSPCRIRKPVQFKDDERCLCRSGVGPGHCQCSPSKLRGTGLLCRLPIVDFLH